MPPSADLSLDYRWMEGSLPPPGHYRLRIRLNSDGAEVALTPDYPRADPPTWTVNLAISTEDRRALIGALRTAGLFDADWQPRMPRRVGGSSWTLSVTTDGRTVSIPRDAIAEVGDPKVVQDAVRALVPDPAWSDLHARRRAYMAAHPQRR